MPKSSTTALLVATVIVSDSVVVRSVRPAAVPRMVTVPVPAAAPAVAVRVRVELVPPAGFGANDAVTPAGRPSAARVTLPAKPVRAMSMVTVPLPPWAIDRVPGVAPSE